MINEKAFKKAQEIPEENQKAEAIKNLQKTTKLLVDASKQLGSEMKTADKCFQSLITSATPHEQQKAQILVQKAKQLINKAKKGGNIEEIVKEIKALK